MSIICDFASIIVVSEENERTHIHTREERKNSNKNLVELSDV